MLAMNRQAFFSFPPLHGRNASIQIASDGFPGFKAVGGFTVQAWQLRLREHGEGR
jgi:hypothetical protein